MNTSPASNLNFDPQDPNYATIFVDTLLELAQATRCSDVHIQPTASGLEVKWRLDGVLQTLGTFPSGEAADVVTRLKVLAELLTYRTDVPQEGRIRDAQQAIEMRVSTLPTVFGERAVIRLFAVAGELLEVSDLGLPDDVIPQLKEMLQATSGAIVIAGPAGSGKSTTAYACLRHLVAESNGGRSIVSLEDPVEVVVPGVAQSQVNLAVEYDLHSGLKSMLRQDPEVIFVGEIRDSETAEIALQAALTGQLVITTFHAGNSAEAVRRLADMGLEPYLLRSALLGIVSQRLVRQLCECAEWETSEIKDTSPSSSSAADPMFANRFRRPKSCQQCKGTGYVGRSVLAELLPIQGNAVASAVLAQTDASEIERLASEDKMPTLWDRATEAVASGTTSMAEVRRVLGLRRGRI